MVDVMLVLLIIFMVVTPMLQKGVSVDMAKVNNPEQMPDADKEDALVVAVMRDGKCSSATTRFRPDQLDQQSERPAGQQADKRVFVRADMREPSSAGGGSRGQRSRRRRRRLGLLTDQRKN